MQLYLLLKHLHHKRFLIGIPNGKNCVPVNNQTDEEENQKKIKENILKEKVLKSIKKYYNRTRIPL